jgi:hypothetical protein
MFPVDSFFSKEKNIKSILKNLKLTQTTRDTAPESTVVGHVNTCRPHYSSFRTFEKKNVAVCNVRTICPT